MAPALLPGRRCSTLVGSTPRAAAPDAAACSASRSDRQCSKDRAGERGGGGAAPPVPSWLPEPPPPHLVQLPAPWLAPVAAAASAPAPFPPPSHACFRGGMLQVGTGVAPVVVPKHRGVLRRRGRRPRRPCGQALQHRGAQAAVGDPFANSSHCHLTHTPDPTNPGHTTTDMLQNTHVGVAQPCPPCPHALSDKLCCAVEGMQHPSQQQDGCRGKEPWGAELPTRTWVGGAPQTVALPHVCRGP